MRTGHFGRLTVMLRLVQVVGILNWDSPEQFSVFCSQFNTVLFVERHIAVSGASRYFILTESKSRSRSVTL